MNDSISDELKEILKDPIFDDVKPKNQKLASDDLLVKSFIEICDFIEKEGRLPLSNGSLHEKQLKARLDGIVNDPDKRRLLIKYDSFSLLHSETDGDSDLNCILQDPIFSEEDDTSSIFVIPQYMKDRENRMPSDFVALRKRCLDFDVYEHRFIEVHQDIKSGKRRVIPFKESHLVEGAFFFVDGVMVYLRKIYDVQKRYGHKMDGRTHCIFENGTDSNMYYRSLGKALHINGYTITENVDTEKHEAEASLSGFLNPTMDFCTGEIYVLRSLSQNPEITKYTNLYKIGYTTTTIEERIENAENESTYLNAKVAVVSSWKIYNVKASLIEGRIHTLFDSQRLKILVDGVYQPQEWFIVPYDIITQAIEHIINGGSFWYNSEIEALIDL